MNTSAVIFTQSRNEENVNMYKSELGFHVQTKNQFQIDFCVYIVIVRGLIR